MARNLKSRLSLIRGRPSHIGEKRGSADPADAVVFPGWENAGHLVLRRAIRLPLAFPVPAVLPWTLPAVLPDLLDGESRFPGSGEIPPAAGPLSPEEILFFDLETTGLSGGAGTVAFLAAFGVFCKESGRGDYAALRVDQFLLLDYPGECDFLDAVLCFINASVDVLNSPKRDPRQVPGDGKRSFRYLATYNGKSFDSQILKTRCLLNGFNPPGISQLDLLHPARRMWKRILPNCSQATVETMILGLDRGGDLPGSLAPDIWFDFLKTNGEKSAAERLLGICDHNVKDITGLASLFSVFTAIAENPIEASRRFRCDGERLALIWRREARRKAAPLFRQPFPAGFAFDAAKLLETAARGYPRSCLRLGFDLFRLGRHEEGRAALARAAAEDVPWLVPRDNDIKVLALRSLAVDAERRLGDAEKAAAYVEQALSAAVSAGSLPRVLLEDLERRRERLKA
ncbi:MAG: ribonuclease H-like domain-containing protein [Treponema sp.]|jgi:hypothetical protein|nr:ribonuclease H-like domain-containing protein [Treponema sp.]